mgnify:CR=1 FL=1
MASKSWSNSSSISRLTSLNNNQLVLGDKEVEATSVNARKYGEQAQNSYPLDEFIANLLDEVKKLNFHERNAIYLYYYEQYSVKEIAAIFETKENTVSSWLHRARKQLKEQLKGGWDDEE